MLDKHEASDLDLKADTPPKCRIKGAIRNLESRPLSNEAVEALVFEIMHDKHKAMYAKMGSADFAYQTANEERFRINVFRQRGKTSMAARRVPLEILDLAQLHLPASIGKLGELHQGLVLLAGITGSGESTAIAAFL